MTHPKLEQLTTGIAEYDLESLSLAELREHRNKLRKLLNLTSNKLDIKEQEESRNESEKKFGILIDASDVEDGELLGRELKKIRELRIESKLSRYGIRTIGDILRCSERDLKYMKSVGGHTISQIKLALASLGIQWPSEKAIADPFFNNESPRMLRW